MALVQQNFADLITLTRASGGGRFNESGVFEWLGKAIKYFPRRLTDDELILLST